MSLLSAIVRSLTPSRQRAATARALPLSAAQDARALAARAMNVRLAAKFDAAQTNHLNRRHWALADGLSAIGALTPDVLRTLRWRGRYEVHNNSFAKGLGLKIANERVGTCPRPQLYGSDDSEGLRRIERSFLDWAMEVMFARKLRTACLSRFDGGECFGAAVTNERLRHAVKLDIRLYEGDQIETTDHAITGKQAVSGIETDEHGNPIAYHVLPAHPGDPLSGFLFGAQHVRVPAERMFHYFRADRPGQARGLPDVTPALPLFANLRRFQLAVIEAAENAANRSIVIETDSPYDDEAENIVEPDALDTIDLEKNQAMFLPNQWKAHGFDATQPTTTYAEYERSIKREIACCVMAPYSVAAGDSQGLNYASGRLDHQTYWRAVRIEREDLEGQVLNRVWAWWLAEAQLVSALWGSGEKQFPLALRNAPLSVRWMYDGNPHVDPAKEATARDKNLRNGSTTLTRELGKEGVDFDEHAEQIEKEEAWRKRTGQPSIFANPNTQPAEGAKPGADDDEGDDAEDAAVPAGTAEVDE